MHILLEYEGCSVSYRWTQFNKLCCNSSRWYWCWKIQVGLRVAMNSAAYKYSVYW